MLAWGCVIQRGEVSSRFLLTHSTYLGSHFYPLRHSGWILLILIIIVWVYSLCPVRFGSLSTNQQIPNSREPSSTSAVQRSASGAGNYMLSDWGSLVWWESGWKAPFCLLSLQPCSSPFHFPTWWQLHIFYILSVTWIWMIQSFQNNYKGEQMVKIPINLLTHAVSGHGHCWAHQQVWEDWGTQKMDQPSIELRSVQKKPERVGKQKRKEKQNKNQ